ncbi:hypothetical protein CPB86DRAFT_778869 [Serendipita vermifera]|nr:hypothetical protein CPB86DRAFT_778869 [Serendipita vermifera]
MTGELLENIDTTALSFLWSYWLTVPFRKNIPPTFAAKKKTATSNGPRLYKGHKSLAVNLGQQGVASQDLLFLSLTGSKATAALLVFACLLHMFYIILIEKEC